MWIFDEANAVEIIWTLYNLVGMVLAAGLCIDVLKDSRNRILMADQARRQATWLCLAFTAVFIGAMFVYVLIGLVSMTQPSLNPDRISPQQIVAAAGFIIVATAKIAVLAAWRWLRFRLRRDGINPSMAIGKASTT
jgi:protein-S-isoprenylcysteine O-methyltransferase Ste14